MARPKLYIHVVGATHFLRWEVPEFTKYFELVDRPIDMRPCCLLVQMRSKKRRIFRR
jgi:hypothetical protein